MNIKDAQVWATNNNLSLDIEYVKNDNKSNNIIIEQEYPDKKRIDLIPNATMKVKVVKNNEDSTNTKIDCMTDISNSACILPNLIGKDKNDFETWGNKFSNVISRKYVEVESNEKVGTILKILDGNDKEINEGISVKTLIDKQITLYINIAKKEETVDNSNNDDNNNEQDNNTNNNENNNTENNNDNTENNQGTNEDNSQDNNENNNSNNNENEDE